MSDAQWIVVNGWERFQHADVLRSKETIPAWLKVYTKLLHNPDFDGLSLAQRGLLLTIWLEFGASDGLLNLPRLSSAVAQIPGQRLRRDTLDSLAEAGFIGLVASRPPKASASLEKRREEDPPTPLERGDETPSTKNGVPTKLTKRELQKYTGCKHTRGTHGFGHKHTPLGMDPPPKDWPHPAPSEKEVVAALAAAADFIAGAGE